MWKMQWLVIFALLASGCGKPAPTGESSTDQNATDAVAANAGTESGAQLDGPGAAVSEFLEALRTGNDERASKMLTATARQKTASLNRNVTPPASDTARFSIGKTDYVNEDGARVACTWTDLDEQGQPKSDEAIWVLRREQEGWRIAGVAAQVFPGESPLLLNFEDPDDMFRKQQWVREEMRRRMEAGSSQAQNEEKPEKSIRR
jgi:hypothetical protein